MEISPDVPSATRETILRSHWDAAINSANTMSEQAAKVRLDIGKDRVAYFEKIAVGAGAAVTLLVTFVSSHSPRLQPKWLFRAALTSLVLAMIAAMFRNWRFPYYLSAVYRKEEIAAIRNKEKARLDYAVFIRPHDMRTGRMVDIEKMTNEFNKMCEALDVKIQESAEDADWTLGHVMLAEHLTLSLVMAGMVGLVVLAWLNF